MRCGRPPHGKMMRVHEPVVAVGALAIALVVAGDSSPFGRAEGSVVSMYDVARCQQPPITSIKPWRPPKFLQSSTSSVPAAQRACPAQGGEETLQPMWGNVGGAENGARYAYAIDAYAIRQHREVEVLLVSSGERWALRYGVEPSCGQYGPKSTKDTKLMCKFSGGETTLARRSDDGGTTGKHTEAVRCNVPSSRWNGGYGISFKLINEANGWSIGPFNANLPLVDSCTKPTYTAKGGAFDATGQKKGSPPLLRYKLAMCTSAMTYETFNRAGDGHFVSTKTGDSIDRLWEWIEYHRNLGVEHFFVYDHSLFRDQSSDAYKMLQSYMRQHLVTIVQWFEFERQGSDGLYDREAIDHPFRDSHPGAGYTAYHQENQIVHCLRKFGPYMRWFASYDTDEYYVPQQHLTLQGALAAIEAKGDYAEASGGQEIMTCQDAEFSPDIPALGRCVYGSLQPATTWNRRWCCSKYWARTDMTLFAGIHSAISFYDMPVTKCHFKCKRRFVSDDRNKNPNLSNRLLRYMHMKHFQICKDCKGAVRSAHWERFGRLIRNGLLARKQRVLGITPPSGSQSTIGELEASQCTGSCNYNLIQPRSKWVNQSAWKQGGA